MPRRRHLVVVLAVVAVTVLALDQATKALALAHLTEGERTPLLGDLLGLQLMRNPGAALSLASGMTWVFTIAAVGVSVVIVRVADRLGSRAWAIALGLLLGGAVGNLVDRLARPPGFGVGHVVDFIAYGDWFIGNVADIAIVAAAVLIVLLTMVGIGIDGRRSGAEDAQPAPDDDLLDDTDQDAEPSDDEPGPVAARPEDAEPAEGAEHAPPTP